MVKVAKPLVTRFILMNRSNRRSFAPYFLCIFEVDFLVRQRLGLYCALLGGVTSLSIPGTKANHLLLSNALAYVKLSTVVVQLISLIIVAGLLYFIAKYFNNVIALARCNEQALLMANQALLARTQELEQKESALQASEIRYQQLVEFSPIGIFMVQKGKIVYSNPAGLRLLGATALSQVVGRSTIEFVHPDYRPHKQARKEQLLTDGVSLPFLQQKVVCLDGVVIDIEFAGIAYRNGGEIVKLFIMYDITERKRVEKKNAELLATLRIQNTQMSALNHRFAETQEANNKRLAQELHDQVSPNLTALDLNLNLIRTVISAHHPLYNQVRERLTDSLELIQQTNELIHAVLTDLRPSILDHYGLCVALKWYVTLLEKRTGLKIHLYCEPAFPKLTESTELALFRIAQEAFTNIVKHAAASEISSSLTADLATVRLSIRDNGRGFAANRLPIEIGNQGLGLLTMQERAAAVGGHCYIESQPGEGTQVIVEVKYDNQNLLG